MNYTSYPHLLCILCILVLLFVSTYSVGTINSCVKATLNLAATGDGKEVTSCAGCDPAQEFCVPGCQNLIKKVYWECDSVCLPDGYYFDPQTELSGCFLPNQPKFKIKVERCGCDAAFSIHTHNPHQLMITFAITTFLVFLLYIYM